VAELRGVCGELADLCGEIGAWRDLLGGNRWLFQWLFHIIPVPEMSDVPFSAPHVPFSAPFDQAAVPLSTTFQLGENDR
jgi:hypothetical protein